MANRLSPSNTFAGLPPPWSLANLDANFSNVQSFANDSSLGYSNGVLVDTGTVNAYVVTCLLGSPSAYNDGMLISFMTANANTGPSTLTVNPLGSVSILTSTGAALTGDEIQANTLTTVIYRSASPAGFYMYVPAPIPVITSVRLRSFNAIGNSTFEVDQRNVGNVVSTPGNNVFLQDRWFVQKAASTTATISTQQSAATIVVPGTNFQLSSKYLYINLSAQQTGTLPAGAFFTITQVVEGPNLRELVNDVHSLSILLSSSVAPVKLGLALVNPAGTWSLTQLATIPTANTYTLVTFPNIPKFTASGGWNLNPGNAGYYLSLCLGAGTTFTASSNNAWIAGNYLGAPGQDNWLANPNGTNLSIAFVQHEPGAYCTTPIDCPFTKNYDECLRYFWKSYPYGTAIGTSTNGYCSMMSTAGSNVYWIGNVPFAKPMAKIPTNLNIYTPGGVLNSVTIFGSSNAPVDTPAFSDKELSSLHSGQTLTAGYACQFNAFADTGW